LGRLFSFTSGCVWGYLLRVYKIKPIYRLLGACKMKEQNVVLKTWRTVAESCKNKGPHHNLKQHLFAAQKRNYPHGFISFAVSYWWVVEPPAGRMSELRYNKN